MKKKCNTCKEIKNINEFYYHKQRKLYMSTCKVCNSIYKKKYDSNLKIKDKLTYQLRSRASELVRRAKYKNLPYEKKMFNLLNEIYQQQNKKCYYTGITMDIDGFQNNNDYCFVVDRINPKLGYIKNNMVFCCNAVNKIKSNYSLDELKLWTDKIFNQTFLLIVLLHQSFV